MKMIRAATLMLVSAIGTAIAAPAWESELTPPGPGAHPALPPIGLDYRLSWKGMIQSGTLRMEFAPKGIKKPGRLVVRSSAASTGHAASLFPYQHDFWTELDPKSLHPRYFKAEEANRKGATITHVRYHPDRVHSSETKVSKKTGATVKSDMTFKHTPVFDIFSAMLHIRSQNLAAGDRISLVVQPFDNPYLLDVVSHGPEQHHGQQAIRMTVSMRKIDRDTRELKPYKKLKRPATLWLSDDDDRVILEVRAAAFIGDVRATLIRREKL